MQLWKERLQTTLKADRDAFTAALDEHAKASEDDVPPRTFDTRARISPDLQCEAVETSPAPYILNVGCGFRPTHVGWRTKDNVPIKAVGVDPLANAINEALNFMATKYPKLTNCRRFVMPIVAEEMGAALPTACFDAVWSEDAILDCVDPFRFVEQCVRVTKIGGVVCLRFKPEAADTLWKVGEHDGAHVVFKGPSNTVVEISEVRGERVELHTMLDGGLMIKVRRPVRNLEQVLAAAQKAGIVLAR